jgi:transposase-like protein
MTQAENRQMWESRAAAFKASSQSATEWCAAHDLKTHQLYYWIRKLKSEDEPTVKQTQWLSVEVGELKTSSHSKALPIRIGKATIEVSPGFDPALLSDVVRTLIVL